MLLVVCTNCYTVVRVLDDEAKLHQLVGEGSDFWPDKYVCISCGKACIGVKESSITVQDLSKAKVRDLDAEQMLAAMSGLGTPDEMLCDITTVRELLARPIKKVQGYTVAGTTRTCLMEIELVDGTKLHFGSSVHGAIVYRITRPISYTQKMLEES